MSYFYKGMKDVKDNFSKQAAGYATFRPHYPTALYNWLFDHCRHFEYALDCATGNGQAASELAHKFKLVHAIDISAGQIANAVQKTNIIYSMHRAEATGFADNSFDLVTVAQSLHWFDHERFFAEVNRITRHSGLFAAWGYSLLQVNREIDDLVSDFYYRMVGPYWDKERKHVDEHYRSIPFPFRPIPCPDFNIEVDWTAEHMLGYLQSWSAVQHYEKAHGQNPVDIIRDNIIKTWGNSPRQVKFPLFVLAGIVEKQV